MSFASRRRPGKYAAVLAAAGLGAGAMLAMTPAAGAATTTPLRPSSAVPTWSIMPTPTVDGGNLDGVSCTSASACTAVGGYLSAANPVTLAERWNGKAWAVQTTPNPSGTQRGILYGVSCASASACTAVGYYYNGSASPVLAERWNGKAWAIQATPVGIQGADNAVSCTSPRACTAVGYYSNSAGVAVTLAERWNGKAWAVQATPNPSGSSNATSGNYLDGVSCTSASACTAVGYYYNNSTGYSLTLAERWNGKAWAVQSTPSISNDYVELNGVSCTSASACIATGNYTSFTGTAGTVAERWNGKAWAMQSIPNPDGTSVLNGVSCAPWASACTAVGSYTNSAGVGMTLAERWNGKAWAVQATPNPSGGGVLGSVSCTSASVCTAYGGGSPGGTLAERYAPSS
jgi:hypothetical protein